MNERIYGRYGGDANERRRKELLKLDDIDRDIDALMVIHSETPAVLEHLIRAKIEVIGARVRLERVAVK